MFEEPQPFERTRLKGHNSLTWFGYHLRVTILRETSRKCMIVVRTLLETLQNDRNPIVNKTLGEGLWASNLKGNDVKFFNFSYNLRKPTKTLVLEVQKSKTLQNMLFDFFGLIFKKTWMIHLNMSDGRDICDICSYGKME